MSEKSELKLTPTETWCSTYWAYNLPLQMWPLDDGQGWHVINYMPRKQVCDELGEPVTPEEMPQFCHNAAVILRNLASLFESMADGKISTIYYPTETIGEAIKREAQGG